MLIVKGKKYSLAGKTHRDIFYFLGNGQMSKRLSIT